MSRPGDSCGICLEPVEPAGCPNASVIATLKRCNELHAVGEICEGDGECGTVRTANNCNEKDDVYRRCASSLHQPPWSPPSAAVLAPSPTRPPSPPQPPLSPLPPCTTLQCDAGAPCGMCLRTLRFSECPTEASALQLPQCAGARPGERCEADGECGTSRTRFVSGCLSCVCCLTAGHVFSACADIKHC